MATTKLLPYFLATLIACSFTVNASSAPFLEPKKPAETLSADGPYVLYGDNGKTRIVRVEQEGILVDTTLTVLPEDFKLPVVSQNGKHRFNVKLHSFSRPAWKTTQPGKVFVLSDPHGNMDCFVSLLRGNNVINERYEWIYGKNHLVIIGDVFDRGKDVLPIFWLIYKLEKEAWDAGGNVSFLLGNHETMVLAGDLRYMEKKYTRLAAELKIDYPELFGPDTELGRWLSTRNTMQVIGRDLYVHAGISGQLLKENLSISQINDEISKALFMSKEERKTYSPLTAMLYGNTGPIWYRGMVSNDEKYFPMHVDTLELILKKYSVNRILVGHTIFPYIRSLYKGRVVTVNVDNKKNSEKVLGRGILIEGKKTYVTGDKEVMGILPF